MGCFSSKPPAEFKHIADFLTANGYHDAKIVCVSRKKHSYLVVNDLGDMVYATSINLGSLIDRNDVKLRVICVREQLMQDGVNFKSKLCDNGDMCLSWGFETELISGRKHYTFRIYCAHKTHFLCLEYDPEVKNAEFEAKLVDFFTHLC